MSRLSRESIAAAAIAIADEDGVDAVSMRRVAQHLDVGTMSLYHYVRDKQELFTVMADAIMTSQLIPDGEVPEGWRAGLEAIGHRAHALFNAHPWILASWHDADRAEPGPSFALHVEQTLATVAELDFLTVGERLELTGLIDEYVTGHVMHNLEPAESQQRWIESLARYAAEGDYPNLSAAFAQEPLEHRAGEFERGLQIVLDGIEAAIERRRPA